MTLRTTLLSLVTLIGITFWGVGVYSGSSLGNHVAVDGYGVSVAVQTQ